MTEELDFIVAIPARYAASRLPGKPLRLLGGEPLVLHVADCRAAYARLRDQGVEFTQEPVDRYGNVDAGFRDPAGNGWKLIQLAAGGAQ